MNKKNRLDLLNILGPYFYLLKATYKKIERKSNTLCFFGHPSYAKYCFMFSKDCKFGCKVLAFFENLYRKSDFGYKTFRTLIDVSKINFLLLQNVSDLHISLISHNEPPPHLWVLSPTWVNHLPPSELNS